MAIFNVVMTIAYMTKIIKKNYLHFMVNYGKGHPFFNAFFGVPFPPLEIVIIMWKKKIHCLICLLLGHIYYLGILALP